MGRPRKTGKDHEHVISLLELFERVQKCETITVLARKLEMNSLLLNN